jgi:hypothetical protein
LLHFELRYVRDVAGQSGKAVSFMPSLELTRDAAGKQGATAFQCRYHCPLTEHRSIGAAELRAVKLKTWLATDGTARLLAAIERGSEAVQTPTLMAAE